jgi:alanine or glycine:cation symporter, AGCS family
MISFIFDTLANVVDSCWGCIGCPIIIFMGLFFSLRSRFVQLRLFPAIFRNFITTFCSARSCDPGALHPIRAFFASIGGSLGIGNVVGVTAAVKIGGPGALLWIWATAIVGSLLKYSEVYLGIVNRTYTKDGRAVGGPLIFLQHAFGRAWPAKLFCVLICIYSVEIYQFGVVASVTSTTFGVSKWVTALAFLSVIVLVERGGFRRVGAIASCVVPFLVFVYVAMGSYILLSNINIIPAICADIVRSAFSVRAAEGAFVGSSILLTMAQGVRSGCYSSDIGVGYASIIHSASSTSQPAKQASLLIFELFVDTFFVCTMSVFLVLVTGTWKENIDPVQLVQTSLAKYFPHMDLFMPFFLTLLGYSVVSTYFSTGMYTIRHFMPSFGPKLFYAYALVAFLLSTFVNVGQASSVMALAGFLLLALNALGIWKLRDQISFAVDVPVPVPELS